VSISLQQLHAELGIPADYAAARNASPYPEALDSGLVEVALNPDGRPVRLTPDAADAWRAMQRAAAADGITLVAISGFRSIARQTEIIREKLSRGMPISEILRSVAAPGFSEHHTACAIDIVSPEHLELDEDFANTAAFRWLEQHAGRFSFRLSFPRNNPHGFVYEPWHWRWHAQSS
jgi:D-alanyl-D-alanine carboxypeptidase